MEVTLYSTHCPQCVILERVLQGKHVEYNVVADMMEIQRVAAACGFKSIPILRVDDVFMKSMDAIRWANAYREDEEPKKEPKEELVEETKDEAKEVAVDDCGQIPPVQEGPELHQEVLQCAECSVGE